MDENQLLREQLEKLERENKDLNEMLDAQHSELSGNAACGQVHKCVSCGAIGTGYEYGWNACTCCDKGMYCDKCMIHTDYGSFCNKECAAKEEADNYV
ncbi:hypothetical protein LCGC14_2052050 [marine sediment metagenome]|uniref:Uncharacterized protein n=2 Tax=root TaxID=1 RepID=A0A0F9ENT7_9ZZZZ|nr:MAG: hypothetical protein LCMAC202_02410 [Marseillevirus LCMAC202]